MCEPQTRLVRKLMSPVPVRGSTKQSSELAPISAPRRGVGASGVIVLLSPPDAEDEVQAGPPGLAGNHGDT